MQLSIGKSNPCYGALVAFEYLQGEAGITLSIRDGAEHNLKDNGVTVYAVSGILRHLARVSRHAALYGSGPLQRTEVDHWIDVSSFRLGCPAEFTAALDLLEHSLSARKFIVGNGVTVADMAVWGSLRGSGEWHGLLARQEAPPHTLRYYTDLGAMPGYKAADCRFPALTPLALPKHLAVNFNAGALKDKTAAPEAKLCESVSLQEKAAGAKERKAEGKFIELPGAEMGKVVVRFPPEASGYLHVGHAKAALLNQFYQVSFEGKLIMRFDDTNPAKEDAEFEKVILEDIEKLGLKPDKFTHTSDSFDIILGYCEQLLREGLAYVDDTAPEVMKQEREERKESLNRNNTPARNLQMWDEMKRGTDFGQKCAVRAKIDMQSDNGCLRDPAMYRCKNELHVRTGTKYKVYPTYDFACPIVDSIEGVTHALRTTEYHDRDSQFLWFIEALGLRKPHVWEYSRLNLQNTVMSKRKLTWFVEEGLVSGWDDPRMPTVRGVLRRGMTVEGLRQFIIAQGSSRSVVMMDWDKIWAFNKKVIDPVVPRYTALTKTEVVPVSVTGAELHETRVNAHPKNTDVGMKVMWYGPLVYIDGADAVTLTVGETVTFINWGNLVITGCRKDHSGNIEGIDARLDLSNTDFKKTAKVTWLADAPAAPFIPTLCVHYDHIITKPVLDKNDDFKDFVNPNTKSEHMMLGDPELAKIKKGDIIQLQRRGFYICDSPYMPPSRYTSRASPCILILVPDGHTKEMPTAGSKHKDTADTKQKPTEADKKPGGRPSKSQIEKATVSSSAAVSCSQSADLNAKIIAQGEVVRRLKSEKAAKDVVQAEVQALLALKAEFKMLTGQDWKPGQVAAPLTDSTATVVVSSAGAAGVAAYVYGKVTSQGEKIRDLKSDKAPKVTVEVEVKILLALKAEFKTIYGEDWKPGMTFCTPAVSVASSTLTDLNTQITSQGQKIRNMKACNITKPQIDAEVKTLLSLKTQFKDVSGIEWVMGVDLPTQGSNTSTTSTASLMGNAAYSLDSSIMAQGEKVRAMKASGMTKAEVDAEVKVLLELKECYKGVTGKQWQLSKPPSSNTSQKPIVTSSRVAVAAKMPVCANSMEASDLHQRIAAQGDLVRQLKAAATDKCEVAKAVTLLLELKAEYKQLTGEDFAQATTPKKKAGKAEKQKGKNTVDTCCEGKQGKQEKNQAEAAVTKEIKKITRLGLEARKEENLADWYSQVITKAEMIEYYDVSGCYVLRPWAFGIWEQVVAYFDKKIKQIGVQNCYFPMFVSQAALQKEKDHIADFAPEVAWVTRSGDTELAEPIAIRPTSETVMYPTYARWVQSHRDLPIKLNQWCNVVRWEFKHPQPFLRTREFLWQEGHTAHATQTDAVEEVYWILERYADVYEKLLAIPVVRGRKTEKEKFAGGDFTTTIEAFVSATGRAIQAATSHHLGQNFSRMFDISFEDPDTQEKSFAYQNSWGMTTRTIGVLVMVHGDNKGLVLPPNIAVYQVVIVPCGITASLPETDKVAILSACKDLQRMLEASDIRVHGDYRDNVSPGWKFNHWELKGVPLRVEVGAREVQTKQLVCVRRDTGDKMNLALDSTCSASVQGVLDTIQLDMYNRACAELTASIVVCTEFEALCDALTEKKLIQAPFCGRIACEENIKKLSARDAVVEEGAPAMGAKGLCIPFKQPADISAGQACIGPGCPDTPTAYTMFGRSY